MRGLRVLLGNHRWLGMVSVCLCVAGAWLAFAQASFTYPPGTVEIEDIYDLADWFRGQQERFLPIMPPMEDVFMQTGHPAVLPFDPMEFPQECKAGLVGDIEYGVPVYDLFLVEDPTTREFVIYNVDYEEVCSLTAPAGYDSAAFAKDRYPELYSGGYSASQIGWILEVYDPSRIQIAVRLVPDEFFSAYLGGFESAAALSSASLGGISMMCSGTPGYTGLWVCAEGPESGWSSQVEVTVHLPPGFTNKVDVYSVDTAAFDGTATVWYAVATNLQASGTNDFVLWTNAPVSDAESRYYTAGSDYDEDGDGLSSAEEILTYKSRVDDVDSDDDGYADGPTGAVSTNDYPGGIADGTNVIGELSLRTDPTNDDTTAPTVTITWPTDGFEEVWVP